MLLSFTVENHRSLRERATVSWVASRLDDHDHVRFPTAHARHGVVPLVALVGPNASGKSNTLQALEAMVAHILLSHAERRPTEPVPVSPSRFGPPDAPTTFTCDFLLGDVRHHYGFTCVGEGFLEEWLYVWPEGTRQRWFHRHGADRKAWYFGPALQGAKARIAELTRDNSLFLSAAAQNNHPQLTPVYRWFADRFEPPAAHAPGQRLVFPASPLFEPENRERVLRLLRAADLGIVDFRIESRRERPETLGEASASRLRSAAAEPELPYLSRSDDPKVLVLGHATADGEVQWFDEDQESGGTVALVHHLHALLPRLRTGGVWVVDELDRAMHPHLVRAVLDLFTDPASNTGRAQLLFTTHDVSLLDHLRRDEVVLVEKTADGGTALVPLTDYKPLKRDGLRAAYEEGRYGAIPRLGSFAHAVAEGR
jgi:hypothetical protein